MNQQCKVCGEPAAGFHFGAFTCEGCKSFFGRTYNNLGSITECKNGGICEITKKNRTACKACRLRKCLNVGMSKSGSRYGRRSNWFKIHCLLQEHQNALGAGHPGFNILPGLLPPPNSQEIFDEQNPLPSRAELIRQSELLTTAMMNQIHGKTNKSTNPDDIALERHLKRAWPKEQIPQHHHLQQPTTTPPRDVSPPLFSYKQPMYSASYAHKDILPTSPPEMFRPFLPNYKRAADTPSDSGASSIDANEQDESRSNSGLSYFKNSGSPTLSERDYPPRKIRATVTLTTGYGQSLGLAYPTPALITPTAQPPQHSPRGGDLHLVSPSPGGIAVEQDKPIDLSVKSIRSSPRPTQDDKLFTSQPGEEINSKGKPLDLTLGIKRPAQLPLTL